jgi:hypothetical protein
VAAQIYESPEHRGLQVDRFYQTFLHRAPNPAERGYWVNTFLLGANETEVALLFVTSPEYQADHPDANSFVTGLYNDVLGRGATFSEVEFWVQALQNGASRADVAQAFLTSTEATQQLVNLDYRVYLGRAGDSEEVQFWVTLLQNQSLTPTTVAEGFLASDEFYSRPR